AEASFVMQLPQGLDTMCGEDGNGLSDGQCQRIAIARALLRRGGVLLLDEATSALDSKTENRLLENLCNTYKGNKTILFISHRETVAKFADALLEFESR
ncbi:MAG: ABC transporter ATP-binding protein, partial [Bacteroidales bacterium]|nr:ABC transporter ATP-binding protein [Bacteroidales bacterium]